MPPLLPLSRPHVSPGALYASVVRLDARLAGRRPVRVLAASLVVLLGVGLGSVRDETPVAPATAVQAAHSSPAAAGPAAPAEAPPVVAVPVAPAAPPAPAAAAAPARPPAWSTTPRVLEVSPPPPAVPVGPQSDVVPTLPEARDGADAEQPVTALSAPERTVELGERWLPTGTGMWLHEWNRTEGGDAAAVVRRALDIGLSHLYVQTGSSKKGWIGEEVLSELLPATEGTGLAVIAWDFPKLIDPEADARRMVQAATWSRPGVPRVAAVAPDVETAAEGTHLSAEKVRRYYATLRAELPPSVAVLATVPWPSEKRTGSYPYAETAALSDAFVPMAYWYNRAPEVVTATSMSWLAQFGLPVMPVGQGYDGRIDVKWLAPDPAPDRSVQAFVDAARAGGARSISLWSWQTTGPLQWGVLDRAGDRPRG